MQTKKLGADPIIINKVNKRSPDDYIYPALVLFVCNVIVRWVPDSEVKSSQHNSTQLNSTVSVPHIPIFTIGNKHRSASLHLKPKIC